MLEWHHILAIIHRIIKFSLIPSFKKVALVSCSLNTSKVKPYLHPNFDIIWLQTGSRCVFELKGDYRPVFSYGVNIPSSFSFFCWNIPESGVEDYLVPRIKVLFQNLLRKLFLVPPPLVPKPSSLFFTKQNNLTCRFM